MKNQRKLFAALLAGALLLSMVACGQTAQPSGGSSSGDQSAGSSAPQTTPGLVTTAAGQIQGTEENGVYQLSLIHI